MRVKARYLLLTTATLAVLVSCGDQSSLPTPGPSPLAPSPTPAPAPQPPPLDLPGPGVTLSGKILEVLPDGTRRPISARQVHVEVDVASVTDPQRGGWVPVGADGSYRLTGVLDERFVKITAVDTTGLSSRYRFCGTNTITRGDTELDVPLFLPGAIVPTPTLSGQVFTVIDGQPVPLAGADVYYQSSRGHGSDVWEYTDHEGRYSLCGIPPMPGTLSMICGNDITAYSQAIDIRENTVIDIDATRFYTCLGLAAPR